VIRTKKKKHHYLFEAPSTVNKGYMSVKTIIKKFDWYERCIAAKCFDRFVEYV